MKYKYKKKLLTYTHTLHIISNYNAVDFQMNIIAYVTNIKNVICFFLMRNIYIHCIFTNYVLITVLAIKANSPDI